MGCDIHVYLEKYTSVNGENKWVNVDHWQINPHFGILENESEYDHVPFYWGRNYDLFSILAEIRGSMDPIDDPRGLPEDVTETTRKEYESGDMVHTASYYTLKELKDYLYNNSDNEEVVENLKYFVDCMDNRFKEEFWSRIRNIKNINYNIIFFKIFSTS